MNKLIWIDSKRNIRKTYSDLLYELNQDILYSEIIFESNPYCIFLKLIFALINGLSAILIDSDFSEKEFELLEIDMKKTKSIKYEKKEKVESIDDIFNLIKKNKEKFRLSLYTSGTTGNPKKINHNFDTLTKNLKISKKNAENIWGFAYNSSHFAGIQVFIQGFFNRNTFVNIFDLNRIDVSNEIRKYKISNISATPTFYRFLLPYFNEEFHTVKNITFGGEKIDMNLKDKLKKYFPVARINNIYASTEAGSLFYTHGELFEIPENIKKYVKFNIENELLIHKKLLAESEEIKLENDWYNSGDIVEFLEANKFRFIQRKSDILNIGGYNVNPIEIEEVILKEEDVEDVIVFGVKNKYLGNILCADICLKNGVDKNFFTEKLYRNMRSTLQKIKIPRIIKYVDYIRKTKTGKKVRK